MGNYIVLQIRIHVNITVVLHKKNQYYNVVFKKHHDIG